MQARSSYVRLIYDGKNITRDIAPYLTQFSFTDNSGGKADDISFTLEDRDGLFISSWYPEKGSKIKAVIIKIDGSHAEALPCGEYEIDQIDFAAPPRTLTIKAISTAISKNMRHEKHNKSWENISLQAIAAELASANNLKLYYDGDNPFYERKTQSGISDLEFLKALCDDAGLSLKVHDMKLIIYDTEKNSERDSVTEINIADKNLLTWKFSSKSTKIYKSAKVSYHDPVKDETFTGEFHDGNEEGCDEILELNERVESNAQAISLAEKRLLQANSGEVKASISTIGNVDFLAGNNLTLSGFGVFDGKYTIEKVTHSLGSGYTSSLELFMGHTEKAKVKAKKSARKVKAAKIQAQASTQKTHELYYEGDKYYGAD